MKTKNKIKVFGFGLLALMAIAAVGANDTVAKADYAGRDYNSAFDLMLDDFSSSTPKGTPSNASDFNANPYLHVAIDNSGEAKSGHSEDSSIYKQATGNYAIENYSLKLRMKGTLELNELILGLRGDDAWDIHKINLSTALDSDGESLPALSATEYKDFEINWLMTIDDDSVEYKMRGTDTNSGTKVTSKVLGFHLLTTESSVGTIDIEKISIVDTTGETVLEDFNHSKPNDPSDILWWRDSVGRIVPRHIALNNSSYTVASSAEKGYSHLILSMDSDVAVPSATAEITYTEGTETLAYANLASYDTTIPGLNTGRININVPINADKIVSSIKLSTTTDTVRIYQVFLSNLESKTPVRVYPALDTANAVVFDNFNRTQSGFNGDYDASSTDPLITGNGLYYALSYNNGDKVKVENGALVFDATELGDGYINFKEGSSRSGEGKDYMVIVAKGEEGASLNGFRILQNGEQFAHSWRSAFGLPVPALGATNPYTTADGYQWLVIDFAESGFSITDTIDLYYSGTGKLYIDEIFFCDKVEGPDYSTPVAGGDAADIAITGDAYMYHYGGYADGSSRYYELQVSGDGVVTLESFRMQLGANTFSIKDKQLYDMNGELVSSELTTETRTIVIDLELSGFNWKVADHVHLHFGAWGVGGDGTISIKSLKFYHPKGISRDTVIYADALGEKTISATDYGYLFGNINPNVHAQYLEMKMQATAAGTNLLESVRIEAEGQGHTEYFNANKLIDDKGNVIGMTAIDDGEEHTIVIDLVASGFDPEIITKFHFHAGGWGPNTTINFKEISVISDQPSYTAVMASKKVSDVTDPTIVYSPALTAVEGDEIVVNPTVSDDVSEAENITVNITVTKGSGDDVTEVTLTDGKFVAEIGVYSITITAIDEAGNESSLTVQITVTAREVEPGPGDGDPTTSVPPTSTPVDDEEPVENGGCASCGKASASVVGTVVLLTLVTLVVLAKKRD